MEDIRKVILDGQKIEFRELKIENKKIDRKIMKKNLFELKEIFDKYNIFHGIIFGTLLGAIREGNFIKHDTDADIYILAEDRYKIINLIEEFRKNSFEVIRVKPHLISVIKNGNCIDFYFFKKVGGKRVCAFVKFKCELIEEVRKYPFLGNDINIPIGAKKIIYLMYGRNWKTPIEDFFTAPYHLRVYHNILKKTKLDKLIEEAKKTLKRIVKKSQELPQENSE